MDNNDIELNEHQTDIYDDLIKEFSDGRKKIYEMLEELDNISKNVKELFPDKFDSRYRMIFQERVKAVTELFKACLDMRKEISKNIKEEFELRKKIGPSDSIDGLEELLNISSMAEKIEDFQKTLIKTKKRAKINEMEVADE